MAGRALRGRVYGRVQGVGFRYYTQMTARHLGVTGWVRNRMDGSVEVYAQGDRQSLASFEAYLRDGPPSAHVDRADIRYVDSDDTFDSFSVRG